VTFSWFSLVFFGVAWFGLEKFGLSVDGFNPAAAKQRL
jgi:hypothetical protein